MEVEGKAGSLRYTAGLFRVSSYKPAHPQPSRGVELQGPGPFWSHESGVRSLELDKSQLPANLAERRERLIEIFAGMGS